MIVISLLWSLPGSRDCENGKLFISSIKCEHLAFWQEEEGKRIKTPTGAKGPPEAKGGSWGDPNGNNKTTEEACFGVLFLIFRGGGEKQGKLWPWVNKQTKSSLLNTSKLAELFLQHRVTLQDLNVLKRKVSVQECHLKDLRQESRTRQ